MISSDFTIINLAVKKMLQPCVFTSCQLGFPLFFNDAMFFLWKTDTRPQTCHSPPIQPLRQTDTPSSAHTHTHTFSHSHGAYENSSHLCFYVLFISTVNGRHSRRGQRLRPAWKRADYPLICSIPTLVKSPADTQENHVFCSSGTLGLGFVLQQDFYLR